MKELRIALPWKKVNNPKYRIKIKKEVPP